MHKKALSLGLTYLKDYKQTWKRFNVWKNAAKVSREASTKTGAGKQRARTSAELILDEIDEIFLNSKGIKSREDISVSYYMNLEIFLTNA